MQISRELSKLIRERKKEVWSKKKLIRLECKRCSQHLELYLPYPEALAQEKEFNRIHKDHDKKISIIQLLLRRFIWI